MTPLMQTLEIPRAAWADRLNEFTAIHEGWRVSPRGHTVNFSPGVGRITRHWLREAAQVLHEVIKSLAAFMLFWRL
jgi:hypothetical protein